MITAYKDVKYGMTILHIVNYGGDIYLRAVADQSDGGPRIEWDVISKHDAIGLINKMPIGEQAGVVIV